MVASEFHSWMQRVFNLTLSSQQAGGQLHRHILVVYHLHHWDIFLHPIGLELVLLVR
jgi:hypothetical protein